MSSNQKMNFIVDSKFFFTSFHTGLVNILFHIVSFYVLYLGLRDNNLLYAFLGYAFFDELGHVYNYFFHHHRDPIFNPIRMIPYQILYTLPPFLIILKIYKVI